jgi:hypothetical protein
MKMACEIPSKNYYAFNGSPIVLEGFIFPD